jgi:hypothetical protein
LNLAFNNYLLHVRRFVMGVQIRYLDFLVILPKRIVIFMIASKSGDRVFNTSLGIRYIA